MNTDGPFDVDKIAKEEKRKIAKEFKKNLKQPIERAKPKIILPEHIKREYEWSRPFKVGEVYNIKGIPLKVKQIDTKRIILVPVISRIFR